LAIFILVLVLVLEPSRPRFMSMTWTDSRKNVKNAIINTDLV